jgi:enoyl-[acyl-carrier-protein] reductase (NADH)
MLKPPGTAEEVAACILFPASNEVSYVTGSLLFVDGAMTAMQARRMQEGSFLALWGDPLTAALE